MKGVSYLPCQKNCHALPGCHKSCPHFRAMQEQQHRDLIRKKKYLRRADESCRAVLHQCARRAGIWGRCPIDRRPCPTLYYLYNMAQEVFPMVRPDDRHGLLAQKALPADAGDIAVADDLLDTPRRTRTACRHGRQYDRRQQGDHRV